MLNRLIDLGIVNRQIVVLALLALIAAAAILLPKLNLDAFPDVTNVQVVVNTEANGLAAEEIEQLVTYPIEAVMYAAPNVEEVRSISRTGLSVVTVVFKEGTDLYFARQMVFERLQTAKSQIPTGAGLPQIGPNTSGIGQVFQYVLRTKNPQQFDAMALRGLNDWVVKLLLMPVDGVTQVLSFGGEVRQYQVRIDPTKLLSYGVRVDDIRDAIEASNRNAGGLFLDRGAEQLVIRGIGMMRSGNQGLDDIASVPIKEDKGAVVRVRDVAQVAFGGEVRQGAVTMTAREPDGAITSMGEVVSGIVLKRVGANTKATIDGIKERLPLIQKALPEGVTLDPIYDQSDLVDKAVATVVKAMLETFVLVIVVLILFLMNLRAALLVLLSVPISAGLALMAMSYLGISANLMSLGGLTIAIGMMVDGSVVMMENIFVHVTQPRPPSLAGGPVGSSGLTLRIQQAAREVSRPVFFAVIIIIVVFTPLFSLEGIEGKLFQPMAVSIVLAMAASLLVALVVIPALATYLLSAGVHHKDSYIFPPIERLYGNVLPVALRHPRKIVLGALGFFALSLATVPFIGTEFMPELEEGTLNIRITLPAASSLDTALGVATKLEARLQGFPEVTYASSRIGRAELGGDPEPVNNIEILVGLKPIAEWTTAPNRKALQVQMERSMSVMPGLQLSFSQPIASRVDELMSGVKAQLAVKLFGPSLDVLSAKGLEIESLVKRIPGTRDVAMEKIAGEAQLTITPNREALARYGISVGQVMALVSDAIGGAGAGQIIRGNERYDIYLRLDHRFIATPEAIRDLVIQAANGAWVKLGDVATVIIDSGPPQIRRDDVQRRIVIEANVEGRDMGGLVAELRQAIETQVKLPPGYTVVYGGQYQNQERAQARLMIVVPLSLAMIFLLLYFAFHSVGQAALIMLNVPLAMIGGIFALLVSGQYLSVPGSIGFIALFGVAVLNGVVMVNAINQNILGGMPITHAISQGAFSRLRPVLMTAFIAALGLIPMLISNGVGSEVQRPLATVVVGGLISSTLLTLVILPVLYRTFSSGIIREWLITHQTRN
ncbi:efflux RND transporter permease subunit [Magnetospirillum molischianum]|uniref:Heavy metal efflux pump, CzcA family n=1 Tax=Magnetospirillum molischianum DSM 120 TaxID=1150626 RepID=H8FSN3_MAGML|nr:CusA/CzcA family heavy metal efflux RND transporter [Magnetospirillum molischianum]CCG41371.1 Heavy metal efflux pump, CzcA family [Magnetospirillum molischianum DSM 120]